MLEIFKGDQETEKHGGSAQREGKQWEATLGKGVHTPTFISLALELSLALPLLEGHSGRE